jgi:hypothetical protein
MDQLSRDLHDAVLLKIEHDWQSRKCTRNLPLIVDT